MSHPPFEGFEGSYLGNRNVLQPGSRLECKICWWVYDPALGDPQWQIASGTPFAELPAHWRCPQCDCESDQFLLLPDHDADHDHRSDRQSDHHSDHHSGTT